MFLGRTKNITMAVASLTLLLFIGLPVASLAFTGSSLGTFQRGLAPLVSPIGSHCITTEATYLRALLLDDDNIQDESRRQVFQVFAAVTGASLLFGSPEFACAIEGATPEKPVAILGGGGRTGMEVAQALAKEGLYAVTMTRSGKDPFQVIKLPPEIKSHVAHYSEPVNVCKPDGLLNALENVHASAVIFAASASKQGGSAFEVDDEGVGNAAEAARALGARFILISALAVDKPDSKSYKITNTLGGNLDKIMDAKLNGENKVRTTMKKDKNYAIIRPGPLMSGKSKGGAADIEVNQGDFIGGGISRDELAGVAVGALVSGFKGATVEVYRTKTRTKLQPEFEMPTGREVTSDTYAGLFASVQPDA